MNEVAREGGGLEEAGPVGADRKEETLVAKTLVVKTLVVKTLVVKTLVVKTLVVKTLVAKALVVKALVVKALVVKALAVKALAGTTLAGTTLAGTTLAGKTLAVKTLAGTTLAGTTLAGTTLAGTTQLLCPMTAIRREAMRRMTRRVKIDRNGDDRVADVGGVPRKARMGRGVVKTRAKQGSLWRRVPRTGQKLEENGVGGQAIKPTMRESRQNPVTVTKVMPSRSRVVGDLVEGVRGDVADEAEANRTGPNKLKRNRKSPSLLMTLIRWRQTTAKSILRSLIEKYRTGQRRLRWLLNRISPGVASREAVVQVEGARREVSPLADGVHADSGGNPKKAVDRQAEPCC